MAFDYEALIIGSGFGATVVATELAKRPNYKNTDPNGTPKIR